ncbi:hypothetical protein [Ralstonia phage RP13]|nr:hypothetical protein [Ralstonia phage RP13]
MSLNRGEGGLLLPPGGLVNKIINGDMDIWQRGTSFTNSSSGGYQYTADRMFVANPAGSGSTTISQSTNTPDNIGYSLSLVSTFAAANLQYRIESLDCYDLIGKTVTLQFQYYVGDNTGAQLTLNIYTPTAVDNYAGANNLVGYPQYVDAAPQSGIWKTAAIQFVVPASAINGLGFSLSRNNTQGTSVTTLFDRMQLVLGKTNLAWQRRLYSHEFALCQRYYQADTFHCGGAPVSAGVGSTAIASNTTVIQGHKPLPVAMRVQPTMVFKDLGGNVGTYTFFSNSQTNGNTMSSGGFSAPSNTFVDMDASTGSAIVTWCRVTYTLSAEIF